MSQEITNFVFGILLAATPLIFASLGGLLSERCGVVQLALEGNMLISALAAAIVALKTGSAWLGFFSGGLAGVGAAIVFSFFALFLGADQVIVGTAINLLALGVAPFVTKLLFNSTGSTPSLEMSARFSYEPLVVAAIVVVLMHYLFHRTKAGLLLRFAGEEPKTLVGAGFSLRKVRWISLLSSGFLTGLGGATLSLFLASNYAPNMTAGRGFMALAALIFGKWRPLPTVIACLFFAVTDSIQVQLQGAVTSVPVQMIQAFPYLITIIALAGFFGSSNAPRALGKKETLT